MRLIERLFRSGAVTPAPLSDHPEPERRCYLIGDLHGCLDKMQAMMALVARDGGGQAAHLVFLGDYVDRGPDSIGVLRAVQALEQAAPDRVTCLMGNHDRMMLGFLEQPEKSGSWLNYGGRETLQSPQIGVDLSGFGVRMSQQAEALGAALGPGLRAWLAARPLWWRTGNVVAVHAQTDPRRALDRQEEKTLLWARPPETPVPRTDGLWVVHGHTVVETPQVRAGHVNVDTGACFGGPLSAAVLEPGAPVRFLQVR